MELVVTVCTLCETHAAHVWYSVLVTDWYELCHMRVDDDVKVGSSESIREI